MFTGIVEELGQVLAVERRDASARVTVGGPLVTSDARAGDSIAVDGCCLTVTEVSDGSFSADLLPETLRRTSLGRLGGGEPVNLERPLTLAGRLGGHLVQGHVDGTGSVLERRGQGDSVVLRVSVPTDLMAYVVPQGSIAVDGVSLTVVAAGEAELTVSLIPATLELTTLGRKRVSDPVNLEVDLLAKYVERLLQRGVRP